MSKPVILVMGKNGQLSNELEVLSPSYNQYNFVFCGFPEVDITNDELLNELFNQHKPAFCINAAAYTAVDKAETEQDITLQVNAHAVGTLATLCNNIGAGFVHVSTDYVFSGNADSPYTEDSPTDPVNFYGYSKLKGEELALQNYPETVVIRTSWVYSVFGHNFVKTMRRLMSERESLNVVSDQVGSPTYAADLARVIMEVIGRLHEGKKDVGGIYHFSNEGIISWFDFAVAIKELSGLSCTINPVPSTAYPTPAKRPFYSGLSKQKIAEVFGVNVPEWKQSLEHCIRLLEKQ